MSTYIRSQILEEIDCDIEFEAGSGYIRYSDYGSKMTVILEITRMITEGIIGVDFNAEDLPIVEGGWFYRK